MLIEQNIGLEQPGLGVETFRTYNQQEYSELRMIAFTFYFRVYLLLYTNDRAIHAACIGSKKGSRHCRSKV